MSTMRAVGVAFGAAMLLASSAANAALSDPAGDFLPTFVGTKGGDLDVRSVDVTFDGTNFILDAILGANVGTTPGAFYVWGVDRGQGTSRFGVISGNGGTTYDASKVLFDTVILLRPGGSSQINYLVGGGNAPLPAANILINAAELMATIPAALLPSTGFAFVDYGFNLWPRDGNATAGNLQISDFAPDNAVFVAALIPEPATLALIGLAGALALMRRKPGDAR